MHTGLCRCKAGIVLHYDSVRRPARTCYLGVMQVCRDSERDTTHIADGLRTIRFVCHL